MGDESNFKADIAGRRSFAVSVSDSSSSSSSSSDSSSWKTSKAIHSLLQVQKIPA